MFCFRKFEDDEQIMWCSYERWTFDGSMGCLSCAFETKNTFLLETKTKEEKRREARNQHVAKFEGTHWKLYFNKNGTNGTQGNG